MRNMKKVIALTLALMLILIVEPMFVNSAQGQTLSTIIIKADGSIVQSKIFISTTDKLTYNFTCNITGSITIQRSNITIDGNGYSLIGSRDPRVGRSGFYMYHINNVTIKNLQVVNNFGRGFNLGDSSYNNICDNNITSNGSGITLDFSSYHNNIFNNDISNNNVGILISSGASYNNIYDNYIKSNTDNGIELISGTDYNKIFHNIVANNSQGVILIYSASDNVFYLNNFVNNSLNACASLYLGECFNKWDNGSVGNYWSDYNGADTNGDGIGDSPYTVLVAHSPSEAIREANNNTDNYPLLRPAGSLSIETSGESHWLQVIVIATTTILILTVISLIVFRRHRKTLT